MILRTENESFAHIEYSYDEEMSVAVGGLDDTDNHYGDSDDVDWPMDDHEFGDGSGDHSPPGGGTSDDPPP